MGYHVERKVLPHDSNAAESDVRHDDCLVVKCIRYFCLRQRVLFVVVAVGTGLYCESVGE